MNVLAVDQSLTETGYWVSNEINGVIKSKLKGQIERIANIRDIIRRIVKVSFIDTIVMEGYSFGSTGQFTFTAGELGGAIKLYCFDNSINLIVVPPSLLKKFICSKGQAKKEQMLLQIYKKYGKEFDNNNIADAFSLHKFYKEYVKWIEQEKKEDGFTKVDIECFKKLDSLLQDKE